MGHLFPRMLGRSEYNQRLKDTAPLMEAALRWLAEHTPGSADLLRLMDGTPVPCGQSVVTTKRSDLAGDAGYGYCASHSRFYWGAKLMLIVTADGTVTGFSLANPKLVAERDQVTAMLTHQPANRPHPGSAIVADKGFAGSDFEDFLAGPDLDLTLIRPARKDETAPRPFPNWLRVRLNGTKPMVNGFHHWMKSSTSPPPAGMQPEARRLRQPSADRYSWAMEPRGAPAESHVTADDRCRGPSATSAHRAGCRSSGTVRLRGFRGPRPGRRRRVRRGAGL